MPSEAFIGRAYVQVAGDLVAASMTVIATSGAVPAFCGCGLHLDASTGKKEGVETGPMGTRA